MVSLANLFAQNQWLYKELIECKNLFLDLPVCIGYENLSVKMKQSIDKAFYVSKNELFDF